MQYVCGQMSRAALYKEPVSRLPAAASCLGRHAHPAGRSPNSSSLFLPLAAVVAVAQGLSPAGLFGGSYELRLPLFPQPLGRALKKRSAAQASPPCFRRRRRSAPLLFESTLAAPFARQIKQKLQYPVRILESLVGAGGFEPPKLKAADLQSVPIGHSGTRPYSFLQSCGLPVYVTTESAICQPIIWAGRKKRRNKGRDHKSPPARVRFTASGREGFSA